jgi:hypothetical protein
METTPPVGQQFVTSTFPFQFARTIALVDGLGNVDTSTAISTDMTSSVPYNPLAVVSNDGSQFWLVSNLPTGDITEGGFLYIDGVGATSALQIGPAGSTGSYIGIAGGQLYAASTDLNAGSAAGVWRVGVGLPTMATTLATLPGLQETYQTFFPNSQNPKQLLFFNHLDGTSNNPDTLYIADQSNGLLKFWFNGTRWLLGDGTGRFGQKLVFSGGATGVVGYVVNPGPNAQFQLYVTGSNVQGQNPNQIASFGDSNPYNGGFSPGNFTTLAFVGATGSPPSPNGNENFAGLAFVPGYQTSIRVTSPPSSSPEGTPVVLTATVHASTGTPTGMVTFYDGTTVLGTARVDGRGVATLTISTLVAGRHAISAFYSGDVMDGTSVSVLTIAGGTSPAALLGEPASASPKAKSTDVVLATESPISGNRRLEQVPPNIGGAMPAMSLANLDVFWRLVGTRDRRTIPLASWGFDDED